MSRASGRDRAVGFAIGLHARAARAVCPARADSASENPVAGFWTTRTGQGLRARSPGEGHPAARLDRLPRVRDQASMCGIGGVLHRDGRPIDREILVRMTEVLHHRGPDGRGVRCLGEVGLAHTRLRIVDLTENGQQPMSNEDGTIWIVFNGEIYDFARHRTFLEASGHSFRSQTDTEVLIHLYEQQGLEGLSRLNGMFAYALWDAPRRRLVLARDRTGQKPLYIYEKGAHLAFASEPKALLVDPSVDDSLSDQAIPLYLAHGYVPGPGTFHRHVRKLDPGTFRIIEPLSDETIRYWSPPKTRLPAPSFEEAAREVRRRVDAAVRRRLVADVPVGAFLSGGVDSSIVVSAMARTGQGPVRTFSLGFEGDPRFDETAYARRVAETLGSQHTELLVGPDSFRLLPDILKHWDEPFGDASAIPTSIVSHLARAHTTVVLTGDGGDELFGGYPRFSTVAYSERLPSALRRAIARLASASPNPAQLDGRRAQLLRFAHRLGLEIPERLHAWIAVFSPEELAQLLQGERPEIPLEPPYRREMEQEVLDDPLNLVLRLNAKTYLLEDLNVKVDRASMAYALEARCPFLDVDLMDFVFSLPGSYKINWGRRKWILRRAFADVIPSWVFERKKMGFGIPLGTWFRGPLRALVEDHLRPTTACLYGWLRPEPVHALLDAHLDGRKDYGFKLWTLLMLEAWLQGRQASRAMEKRGAPSETWGRVVG